MKKTLPAQLVTKGISTVNSLRQVFCLLVLLLFVANSANSQNLAANYSLSQATTASSFTSLVAGASVPTLFASGWDDNAAVAIDLTTANASGLITGANFDFKFNNIAQNKLYVSPNGFVTFGATGPTTTNYSPINTIEGSGGAAAVYAANLAGYLTGVITYTITGSAPNRILTVDWGAFTRNGTTGRISMQLLLYEGGTGATNPYLIEMKYKQISALANNEFGQIGLRGAEASLGTMTNAKNMFWDGSVAGPWPTPGSGGLGIGTTRTDTVLTAAGATATTAIPTAGVRSIKWTPIVVACSAPTVSVSNILINSATATLGGATNYQYILNNSSVNPGATAGTPLTAPGTSFNITGLTANTANNYFWLRADCGSGVYSAYVSAGPFTTLCNATNVPYTENFASAANTNIPACTARELISGYSPNLWGTSNPYDSASGYTTPHLTYIQDGTLGANTWFYTEGINLTAGQTYRLSYNYGGTDGSTITNKMDVKYGLGPNAASMLLPLDSHPNIKGIGSSNIVLFTAPSSAVYYFGFKAYSAAAMGRIYLDDISITTSNCVRPTTVSANTITGTSASVTWGQSRR